MSYQARYRLVPEPVTLTRMPVTIADIAARVKKSPQVVSAVLNGGRSGSKASVATQELVRQAAAEMGYRPNAAARAVSLGRFESVGLLLSTVTWKSALRTETLMAITLALAERELRLTVCGLTDDTLNDDGALPTTLHRTHADGFLVCYDTAIPERMRTLLDELGVPVVWLNSLHAANCVVPDEEQAGRLVTEHLLALGHRRIAYLDTFPRDPGNHFASAAKAAGFLAAMKRAGVPPLWANHRPLSWEERPAAIHRLLSSPQRPTAIVTADGDDDPAAVMYAAQGLGLVVPRDLSLATIAPHVLYLVGLACTTAVRPVADVGREAVAMLSRQLASPRQRQPPLRLPFTLAVGATSAAVPS